MTRRGPHESSIHPRKDGHWAGSVHIGYIDGKRVRKHVLGRTRGEVADKLDALFRKRDDGHECEAQDSEHARSIAHDRQDRQGHPAPSP